MKIETVLKLVLRINGTNKLKNDTRNDFRRTKNFLVDKI